MRTIILPILILISFSYLHAQKDEHEALGRVHVAPVDTIKKYTGVEVYVKNGQDFFTTQYNDKTSKYNYMMYWMNHFKDWQWDKKAGMFVNIKDTIMPADKYNNLFNLLTSDNDSLAKDAFIKLGDSDPDEVIPRIFKYDIWSHWRSTENINRNLSSFSWKFLPQITYFTSYCKKNNIEYKPDSTVCLYLAMINGYDELPQGFSGKNIFYLKRKAIDLNRIIQVTNLMISNLKLNDLTKLEYIGMISEGNNNFICYGTGRVLDVLYSKYWNEIIGNKDYLRWYLKKSFLFKKLGVNGYVKNYIYKFSNSDSNTISSIKEIASVTRDKDYKAPDG